MNTQRNIMDEAAAVIDRYLECVEIKQEVEDFLVTHSSRRICRCPSCKNYMRTTEAWLRDMRAAAA